MLVRTSANVRILFLVVGVLLIFLLYYSFHHNTNTTNNNSNFATSNQLSVTDDSYEPLPVIATRQDLPLILNKLKLQVGAEVGVQRALFSEHLLKNWETFQTFYAIDPWIQQQHYEDMANVDQTQQNKLFNEASARLMKFHNPKLNKHIVILRNYSSDALQYIADESLDFLYVDARHDYKSVLEDLEMYWPKVRNGGLISGHDYKDANEVVGQDWCVQNDGTRCENNKAVKGAVDDFTRKVKRQLIVCYKEQNWHTWYFGK